MSTEATNESIVSVDTAPGFTDLPDIVERCGVLLEADERVLGAAASIDTKTGVLGATFNVAAASLREAQSVAIEAFSAAAERARDEISGEQGDVLLERVVVERSPGEDREIAVA